MIRSLDDGGVLRPGGCGHMNRDDAGKSAMFEGLGLDRARSRSSAAWERLGGLKEWRTSV
jgi:hypothetical protein